MSSKRTIEYRRLIHHEKIFFEQYGKEVIFPTSSSRRRPLSSAISCFAAPSSCASLVFSRRVSRNCVSTFAAEAAVLSDVMNVVAEASELALIRRCVLTSPLATASSAVKECGRTLMTSQCGSETISGSECWRGMSMEMSVEEAILTCNMNLNHCM